jgi:DNA-binding NtrC family response regulator
MIKLLVVDDEEPFRRLLKKELARKGFSVDVAAEGKTALRMLKENPYDVMLLDILMPGIDGISLMKKLRKDPAAPPTIVLTAKATIETAVEAMKNGAYDYLTKPYKLDELEIVINRAYEYGNLRFKSRLLQQELVRKESPVAMISGSRQLTDILTLIQKIAPTDSTVLIHGESGTGKELVANTIWHFSKRNKQPFIALNCATLSENLMESELFGHEKGAFTTAYQTKYGIVEVADGGTLFLDEVAEMPMGLQAKLLRFLDLGEFRRVGGNKTLKVDVRVIAATNKNISERVEQGKFREDLFYRLNVINISVPPLRERKQDIPELSSYFLRKYSQGLSRKVSGISKKAMDLLSRYHWPGNVRELENEIERAVTLCDSDKIGPDDLTIKISPSREMSKEFPMLEELEKDYILRVLRETNGNQSKASQILGINRKTLYLKLKSYGIADFKKQVP